MTLDEAIAPMPGIGLRRYGATESTNVRRSTTSWPLGCKNLPCDGTRTVAAV